MERRERRKFSREFKLEALRIARERGAFEAAESLSLNPNMLYRWRKQLESGGAEVFRENPMTIEDEVKALRIRVRELEEEKSILKKAAAYFAKHQR